MTDPWVRWNEMYHQRGVERFVKDGCGPNYGEPDKVLFVLKEPHGTEWVDVRHQLRSAPHRMWLALARWAFGILKGFPAYGAIKQADLRWALERIAAINLKKEGGGGTSDRDIINAFAHRDKDILREQIALFGPNLIIACGADVLTP